MMDATAREVEGNDKYRETMERRRFRHSSDKGHHNSSAAITAAAYYTAQNIGAKALVAYTVSGSTALRMARQRPAMPILCLTPEEDVARRLAVSFGVISNVTADHVEDFVGPAVHAAHKLLELKLAGKGSKFVMTAGMPFGQKGSTNILRIAKVE